MEATIKRELADVERGRVRDVSDERRQSEFTSDEHTNTDHPQTFRSSPDIQRKRDDDDLDTVMVENDNSKAIQTPVNPSNGKQENTNVSAPVDDVERRGSDTTAQDVGDVVIEAGEDTVIY